jgi:diacylglycerol kinase
MTRVRRAECLNAAVEAAIDLSTSAFPPMTRVGKDGALAAVLLGAGAPIVSGLLIALPPLWTTRGLR